MVTCNADLIKIVETRIHLTMGSSTLSIVSWGGVNVDKNMHDRDLYGNEKNFIFHGNVFYFAAVEDETTTFIFMHVRTHLLKRIHMKFLKTY